MNIGRICIIGRMNNNDIEEQARIEQEIVEANGTLDGSVSSDWDEQVLAQRFEVGIPEPDECDDDEPNDNGDDSDDGDDGDDDDGADSEWLASAGYGTDEDYGYFGGGDE